MKQLLRFIKITIAGGILFLIPTVVVLVVITKAMRGLRTVAAPLAEKFPISKVAGIGLITVISFVLLMIVCFLAGIFTRTNFAKKLKKILEEQVLIYVPGYSYLQAMSAELFSKENKSNWRPASIFVDDNEVICFVIDESEHYCSIFLPSAPSPSSGSVCVREKSIVRYLPMSMPEAVTMIRQFGKGAASVLEKIRVNNNP